MTYPGLERDDSVIEGLIVKSQSTQKTCYSYRVVEVVNNTRFYIGQRLTKAELDNEIGGGIKVIIR